jgi:hypothetical protein
LSSAQNMLDTAPLKLGDWSSVSRSFGPMPRPFV